jgi:hypothetical protein
MVVAGDTLGRVATLLFRFPVGYRTAAVRGGRAGLSEQLRQAGQRSVQALERATDPAKPAGRPAVRQAE